MDQRRLLCCNTIKVRMLLSLGVFCAFLIFCVTPCCGQQREAGGRSSELSIKKRLKPRAPGSRSFRYGNNKKQSARYVHDFGTLTEGSSPTHTFTYVNESKLPLNILQLRVSCGCTKVKMGKKSLAPGEKTTFEVKFLTKRRSGQVAKSVYLVTDSKDVSVVRYTIKAYVVSRNSPRCVAPSVINIGKIKVKEKKNVAFVIENKGIRDLVVEMGTTTSFIAVETVLPITIKFRQKRKIKLIVKAPFHEGKLRCNLMLKTNDRSKANLWMSFIADIVK